MAAVRSKPRYQIIDNIRALISFSPKCFKEALSYKPQPDDTIVVSYPKSGTIWLQNVVLFIYRKGEALNHYGEFLLRCPYIDMLGLESVKNMPRPGAIKTHLPLISSQFSSEAKYIFLARNPYDVCVSFYHHTKMIAAYEFQNGTFDDFFELFINGEVDYNDYFDHLLSWYPRRNDKNVYYTTYECMKAEPKVVTYQIAKFLGQEYVEAIEKDNGVMNSILKLSSFDHMKENVNKALNQLADYDRLLADPNIAEGLKHIMENTANIPKELLKFDFVRKGIVGDWKSHFSQEQRSRLEAKCIEKFKGTDLATWWSI